MNPYRKQPASDDLTLLLGAVTTANRACIDAEVRLDLARQARLRAVTAAAGGGASLRDIAAVAGVSAETVRQMLKR